MRKLQRVGYLVHFNYNLCDALNPTDEYIFHTEVFTLLMQLEI